MKLKKYLLSFLFSILSATSLKPMLPYQLTQLDVELTALNSLLTGGPAIFEPTEPQPAPAPIFEPEEFADITMAESLFSKDTSPHYGLVGANKAIADIKILLGSPKKDVGKASEILNVLIEKMKPAKSEADLDQLKKLQSNITKLVASYPLTMPEATKALEIINQYAPTTVFNLVIKIITAPVTYFSKEIDKEITRGILGMADESARKEHRRYIKEALAEGLFFINLALDVYDRYKDYPTISRFDKNQFFSQILFNWQKLKRGHTIINQDLSKNDNEAILLTAESLPTIENPTSTTRRPLENYYQETRERIEGFAVEETIKPLRILLGKVATKLKAASKENEDAVKNFVNTQIPSRPDETAAFLEYNYSEFDTLEKRQRVTATLRAGVQNGIKGTDEARIITALADEIDKYGSFKKDNDELEDLIDQMKKDPTKFTTTETINKIIKKLDDAGKKSDALNDPTLKRDKAEDKKLRDELEKTKKAISTGVDIAPALANALSAFCSPQDVNNQVRFHVKGENVTFYSPSLQIQQRTPEQNKAIATYKNSDRAGQLLILQTILSILMDRCTKGAVKCSICTGNAGGEIRNEILRDNPNAPAWVRLTFR